MKRKESNVTSRREIIKNALKLPFDDSVASYDHYVFKGKLDTVFHNIKSNNIISTLIHKNNVIFGLEDGNIQIWDLRTQKMAKILRSHAAPVLCLLYYSKRDLIISGTGDMVIRIWNSRYENVFSYPTDYIINMAILGDNLIFAINNKIKILSLINYTLISDQKIGAQNILILDNKVITQFASEEKSWVFSGGFLVRDYSSRHSSLGDKYLLRCIDETLLLSRNSSHRLHDTPLRCLILSDQRLLSIDVDKILRVWNQGRSRDICKGNINHFVLLNSGKVLIVYKDKVEIWK